MSTTMTATATLGLNFGGNSLRSPSASPARSRPESTATFGLPAAFSSRSLATTTAAITHSVASSVHQTNLPSTDHFSSFGARGSFIDLEPEPSPPQRASLDMQPFEQSRDGIVHSTPRTNNASIRSGETTANAVATEPERRPRPSKTPAEVNADANWGANFWVTLVEPETHTPFYACPGTGEVSWDPPVGNFVLPPSQEGEWWELYDEGRGGIPYYHHTKTNETVWERPNSAFVIPFGILQNTTLAKRLSLSAMHRLSQVLDGPAKNSRPPSMDSFDPLPAGLTASRNPNRRSKSFGPDRERQHRRTSIESPDRHRQRTPSSPSSPTFGKPYSQGVGYGPNFPPRRSISNDHRIFRDSARDSFHHPLPPIPGSPYATEASDSPSPSRKSTPRELTRERSKGKGKEKDILGKGDEGHLKNSLNGRGYTNGTGTVGRADGSNFNNTSTRSPARGGTTYMPSSIQPLSLDGAAAELLGEYNEGTMASRLARAKNLHIDVSPTPSPRSTKVRPSLGQIIATPKRGEHKRTSSGSTSHSSPPSPNRKIQANGRLTMEASRGRSASSNFLMSLGRSSHDPGRHPLPSPRRPVPPVPPMPDSPTQARRRTSESAALSGINGGGSGQIKTSDIGMPVLDLLATMSMSPSKARAEGKPILLEPRTRARSIVSTETRRLSTGDHPILPFDLASDIQQFVQSDFARQYFSIHRTGFIFRRKVPVERLMAWQKQPLTSPLLVLNRALQKDAVKVFKVIQRIMGDRERDRPVGVRLNQADQPHSLTAASWNNSSTVSLPSSVVGVLEEERWLLSLGLTHGELRDEIYCQLVKQLTGNPNPESLFRGWQLLCVLLVSFPPSKNFESYLRTFMYQFTSETQGRLDVMAKYCIQRLSIIAKKGPRGKAPTIAEIETASDAAFNPSTFGESLDAIYRLQERTYPHLKVPIILPFLADGILALSGTKSEGIFRIPGDADAVSELKIRIEKGYYNLEGIDDPHVPASLLKLWLRELCDPLVPDELYNDCVACANDPEACVQMVSRLPTINRRVVLFIISFLQLFLDDRVQTVTKMTSANLALVMAPNLLRCNSESMTVVFTNAQFEQTFVHNLLVNLKCHKVDPDYLPKHGLGAIKASPTPPRNPKGRTRRHR